MRKLNPTPCAQCQTIPFVTEVAKEIHTIIALPNCTDTFLRKQTVVPTRNFTLPRTHRTTTRRREGSVRTRQVSGWRRTRCFLTAAGWEQQSTARPLTIYRTQRAVVAKAHRKTISHMSMLASSPKSTAEGTCVEPQQKNRFRSNTTWRCSVHLSSAKAPLSVPAASGDPHSKTCCFTATP